MSTLPRSLIHTFLLLAFAGQAALAAVDLDATYITRTPRYYRHAVNYPGGIPQEDSSTAGKKHWPDYNETVTFTAHFINKGDATCPSGWQYKWYVNGGQIGSGNYGSTLAPGAEGTASITWNWNISGLDTDHTDQTVKFQLDTTNAIAETYESQNNAVTDYLECVCLSIWVDTACYDQMNTLVNGAGTKSFEDWIRWQVNTANNNFSRSYYTPLAPNGCLERLRIDKIVVAANAGSAMNSDPDILLIDGRWGFTWSNPADAVSYANTMANQIDWGLVHEIMHQIGIIDLYRLNLDVNTCVVVAPDGTSAGMGWGYPHAGLMGGGDISPWSDGTYLEQHTVIGMNKNVGYRRGYYGEYLYDVPLTNILRILDAGGNPAQGVTVKVFQSNNDQIDNTPEITGTTGVDGTFTLPNRSAGGGVTTPTGHTLRNNPFGIINVVGTNARFLIELSKTGQYDYRWQDILDYDLAYWGGDTTSHTFTIQSRIGVAGALAPASGIMARCEGAKITLSWNPVPSASSYTVYRAGAENNYILSSVGNTASTSYVHNPMPRTSRYTVSSKDASARESGVYERAFAPLLQNPYAVGILSDNRRVVLDPQNGYALIHQGSDGRYTDNFGTVHYHLEYSYDVVVDTTLSRLIFAHAADFYSSNHSIKVTDLTANNPSGLFEIGTTGSGDGQFQNPTGVAVDSSSRIYAADKGNNRIQVFNSSGTFITKFGTFGSGTTNFNGPQNIAVTSAGGKIYVADRGNKRVQILTFDGATISYSSTVSYTFNDPVDVAVAPDGRFFVVDSNGNSIYAFSSGGAYLATYLYPTDGYTGRVSHPMGAVVDKLGNLVVADTSNRRVITIAVTPLLTIKDARQQVDATPIRLGGQVITAKFSDAFYIEDSARIAGMRVASTASLAVGDKVDIYGTVQPTPDPNRERQIVPFSVLKVSSGNTVPGPLGMNLRTMGGGPNGLVPGIAGASGLNNIGLLVRVFGKTSDKNAGASEFYLDDGSGFKVRVHAPGLTLPSNGIRGVVTGISGAYAPIGTNLRVLRAKAWQQVP